MRSREPANRKDKKEIVDPALHFFYGFGHGANSLSTSIYGFIGKPRQGEAQKTFVYRIHDLPNTEKLSNFSSFASKFGYKLNFQTDKEIAHSLNNLMKNIKGTKEQNVLEQLAVRTMAKAQYTTENIGHYGLAFDYYSHFTSPIRRYPDVMAHRLLQHYLDGGKSPGSEELEKKCKHSTEMEIQASDAERASVKFKQVQFLQDKQGQEFEGIVSGVTEWGIYVEIVENKCEGMIRLRDLDDDFYEFDEANYCIIGARTKKKYQLGDNVRVRIKRTDLIKKQIDFEFVGAVGKSSEAEFGFQDESSPESNYKKEPREGSSKSKKKNRRLHK